MNAKNKEEQPSTNQLNTRSYQKSSPSTNPRRFSRASAEALCCCRASTFQRSCLNSKRASCSTAVLSHRRSRSKTPRRRSVRRRSTSKARSENWLWYSRTCLRPSVRTKSWPLRLGYRPPKSTLCRRSTTRLTAATGKPEKMDK